MKLNEKLQNEIKSSEWISLGNTVYYKKSGNIVTVRAYSLGEVALTANDYKVVATLPEGVRPSVTVAFPWARIGEGQVGITRIHNNGVIELYSTSAPSYWAFTITYVI